MSADKSCQKTSPTFESLTLASAVLLVLKDIPMTNNFYRSHSAIVLHYLSVAFLSLALLNTPTTVFAHAGHGNEFQGATEATETPDSIQVDAETAKRLEIKVEPVKSQQLGIGIKTTGQIETLPSQKVEVTAPIPGKVVELLVEPGANVKAGQPVAVVAAPDLVELRVNSQEKQAEAQADLQKAQADFKLAQENLERQHQIATTEIEQASTEVKVAQEQYDRDQDLVKAGALPRRQMLESRAHLAEGKTQLIKALSRKEVLAAEADLKRGQSAVELAKSKLQLSNSAYQTRLQQLGTRANAKGLVTVSAPISGQVADREVTLGQSFQDAGGKLMTIVNDSRVFATANIYEKDLDKVQIGQQVRIKIASLPERNFEGRITRIGSIVNGETRVLPVQAELNNPGGELKPGMFAELEVITDQTSKAILAIPYSAVVDANGKKVVYVQNGNAFQTVQVNLGQISGDLVEIKSGLFEGDLIVTQRAPQLYAQSLRGGSKSKQSEGKVVHSETEVKTNNLPMPLWVLGTLGGVTLATVAAAAFWAGRRTRPRTVAQWDTEASFIYEPDPNLDNHKQPTLSGSAGLINECENPQKSN